MCRVYRKGRHIHATLYSRSHLFMWGYLLYICIDGNTWGFDLDFVSTVQIEWVNCGNGFSHLFSNCMIWLARDSYRHSKRYLVVEMDFVNFLFCLFYCNFTSVSSTKLQELINYRDSVDSHTYAYFYNINYRSRLRA